MKAIFFLLLLLLLPANLFAQAKPSKEIRTNYDRFTDQTTLETDLMRLWGTTYDHLEVSFGAGYKGSKPSTVVFLAIFKQICKDTPLIDTAKIYVIADGERFTLDDIKRLVLKKPLDNLNIYRHEFSVSISVESMIKLAKSKNVELRIGHIETKLLPEHQEIINALIKQLIAKGN